MRKAILFCLFICTSLISLSALACTGIGLNAKDGSMIYGRTLEFGQDFQSDLIVVPHGYQFTGQTADNSSGLTWKTKYAFVGTNASKTLATVDGVNEKGLAVGLFYFPGYAQYQKISPDQYKNSIAAWQLGTWLLGNCADTNDVKNMIGKIKVTGAILPAWGFAPPVHYFIRDAKGKSIVIEYFKGKLHVYDDPVNVLTNAPNFNWHMTNLKNYLHLSPTNVQPITIGEIKLAPSGQGSGLVGLPGDFTPPSRFIRAAILTYSSRQKDDAPETIDQAFHILNQFDVPEGAVRDDVDGKITYEFTLWTSVADLTHKRYCIHTEADRQIRCLDLMKQDLDAKNVVIYPLSQKENIAEFQPSDKYAYKEPN